MLKRILRPALLVIAALMVTTLLTLAFSPAARAAVQGFFTFNGVTVSVDEQTGKLVTSGNTDAIITQTDHEVTIQGENGEVAGAGIAQAQMDGGMVLVSDLLSRYPDLTLPRVPSGYTLEPQAQLMTDGSLLFTWTDPAGLFITYQRSSNPLQSLGAESSLGSADGTSTLPMDGQVTSSTVSIDQPGAISNTIETLRVTTIASSGGIQEIRSEGTTATVTHQWEAGGYYHILSATDSRLTEADLQAMLP
jgi:hypothetical protein